MYEIRYNHTSTLPPKSHFAQAEFCNQHNIIDDGEKEGTCKSHLRGKEYVRRIQFWHSFWTCQLLFVKDGEGPWDGNLVPRLNLHLQLFQRFCLRIQGLLDDMHPMQFRQSGFHRGGSGIEAYTIKVSCFGCSAADNGMSTRGLSLRSRCSVSQQCLHQDRLEVRYTPSKACQSYSSVRHREWPCLTSITMCRDGIPVHPIQMKDIVFFNPERAVAKPPSETLNLYSPYLVSVYSGNGKLHRSVSWWWWEDDWLRWEDGNVGRHPWHCQWEKVHRLWEGFPWQPVALKTMLLWSCCLAVAVSGDAESQGGVRGSLVGQRTFLYKLIN